MSLTKRKGLVAESSRSCNSGIFMPIGGWRSTNRVSSRSYMSPFLSTLAWCLTPVMLVFMLGHHATVGGYVKVPSMLTCERRLWSHCWIMFDGYKTSSVLLLLVGTAVIVFGLLPGGSFFTESLTLRGIVKKPVPIWFGRLWFIAAEVLLVCWGLTHGRP